MQKVQFQTKNCAVARVLELVGEWWSMLIILELFSGSCEKKELGENLGISPSILTNRLNKLSKHGIVQTFALDPAGARQGYRLTDKGRDLLPSFVALHQWGNQWLEWPEGLALRIIDYESQNDLPPLRLRNEKGELLFGGDIRLVAGEGADELILKRFGNGL